MEISARHNGEAAIVDIVGDITLFNSPEVRKTLLGLLNETQVSSLLVNMKGVRYVDSSGVASLVEGLKAARDRRSRFALCALTRSAREVLELTRLTRVFEIHETEEEALRVWSLPAGVAGGTAGGTD